MRLNCIKNINKKLLYFSSGNYVNRPSRTYYSKHLEHFIYKLRVYIISECTENNEIIIILSVDVFILLNIPHAEQKLTICAYIPT